MRFCSVEQGLRAENIGLKENVGVCDASVHMALRREVHDGVKVEFIKQLVYKRPVVDIALCEEISLVLAYIRKVVKISRVCKQIEIDNADVAVVFKQVMYEI